jgi:hypothetical protein
MHVTGNQSQILLTGIIVTTIDVTLLGALKTDCRAGASCDRMIVEYCNVLLILGICNSRVGTATQEHMLRYPGIVIETLIYFGDWRSVSVTQEL